MNIKAWTIVSFILLIIVPICQAKPTIVNKETITLAHPKQVGVGQPFLVRLTSEQAFNNVSIQWMGKSIEPSISQWNKHHVAIAMLGTDVLTIKPGSQILSIKALVGEEETVLKRTVTIVARSYPRQELSLPPKMVTPPTAELKRIKEERARVQKAKKTWSDKRLWQIPFLRPVEGKTTSAYGLRRILNGQPKNPHRGLDFRAPTGTAVKAVAAGRVILAESHYYAGNSLYIDHGNGVISLYFHMNTFNVSQGDIVARGQIVGQAGSTGRSTGPHLHLSISVQGQLVDPAPLLKETTDQLLK